MRNPLHARNLIVGGLVVFLALFAMGQVFDAYPGRPARFTIVTGQPDLTGQPVAYVLDTTTGQVWSGSRHSKAFFDPKVDPNVSRILR
jgi:hypothetical protein